MILRKFRPSAIIILLTITTGIARPAPPQKLSPTVIRGKYHNENQLLNEFFREGIFNPGNTLLYNSTEYTPLNFLAEMDSLNGQNKENFRSFVAEHQPSEKQLNVLNALMQRKKYGTLLEYSMKHYNAIRHASSVRPDDREELAQYFKNITSMLENDIDQIASYVSVDVLMDRYLIYLKEAKLGMDNKMIIDMGEILTFMDLVNETIESSTLRDQLFYRINISYMEYNPGNFERNKDQLISKISSKNIRDKVASYWQFLKYQRIHIQPMENYQLKDVLVSENLEKAIKEAKGKTIYLDFWAPWCAPCLEDMKASKNAVAEAEAKGDVVVIYVGVEKHEKAQRNFIETNQIPGKHISIPGEARARIMSNFGNTGYPFQVIISPNGGIMAKGNQYRFTAPVTQQMLNYSKP